MEDPQKSDVFWPDTVTENIESLQNRNSEFAKVAVGANRATDLRIVRNNARAPGDFGRDPSGKRGLPSLQKFSNPQC